MGNNEPRPAGKWTAAFWLNIPPLKTNKEAWMALAGIWKDDPYVEEELKEIYRRRGRPMTDDKS